MSNDRIQARFDEFIMTHDDLITVTTATALAKDLGVKFTPEFFDH